MIWTIIDGQLIAKNTVSTQSLATQDVSFHTSRGIKTEENVRYVLRIYEWLQQDLSRQMSNLIIYPLFEVVW